MMARALRAFLCAFCAMAWIGGALHAQVVTVQTGDHAEFARMVLSIGEDRDWELTALEEGRWRISLDPAVDGFDLSTAFQRIQRNRIANLSTNPARASDLEIELACPCDVSGFRFQDRFLVIDVADATDPETTASAENEAPASVSPAPQSANTRRINPANNSPLPDLARLLLAQSRVRAAGPVIPDFARLTPPPSAVPAQTASPPPPPAPVSNPSDVSVADAAQIMAAQLARAAAAGLLDIDPAQPPNAAGAPLNENPPPLGPRAEGEAIAVSGRSDDPPLSALPIRTDSAFDFGSEIASALSTSAAPAGSCTGSALGLRDWAEEERLDFGLGTLRAAVFDERFVIQPEAVENLARHYLYFGFGAEAHYWLNQIETPSRDLVAISNLVEGAPQDVYPTVDTTAACSDDELLWRYLGQAVAADFTPEDAAAVQRAFMELPPRLRDLTGPDLARQLLEDGFDSTARNIRDALHRGARLNETALRMLDLELGLPPDRHPEITREALAEGLRDDGGEPARVMAHALAFDRMQGLPTSPDRLVAAEALLRETGSGAETDMLWQEVLIGRAALGQIDQAMNMLEDRARAPEVWTEALTGLIADRVAVEDTASLLILAYRFGADWEPQGSEAGRVQVRAMSELREAGLFRAADILRSARQALILPARPEPQAAPPDPAQEAWRRQDWDALAQTGRGAHADIAARLAFLESDAAVAPPATDLEAISANLTDSQDLRASIASLLAQPTLP